MTPDELAAIRERHRKWQETLLGADPTEAWVGDAWATDDVGRLLAHIDAITEAVEGMPAVVTFSRCWDDHEGPDGGHADGSECPDQLRPPRQGVDRAAVLALLRGAR